MFAHMVFKILFPFLLLHYEIFLQKECPKTDIASSPQEQQQN